MGGVSLNALYNEVALGRWVERTILGLNVTPLVGAILRDVRLTGRRVEALELATRYGDVIVQAGGFVDATGDAFSWYGKRKRLDWGRAGLKAGIGRLCR